MMKMMIKINEEKILREDVINLKKVYAALDSFFEMADLKKEGKEPDGTIVYAGKETNKDFANFCLVAGWLKRDNPWFALNCEKWLWGDDDMIEGVWDWEDVLEQMRERGE